MAQQTIVRYLDDLDGTESAQQVRFGLDGKAYEIDLTEVNELRLRSFLAPFVEAARKASRTVASPPKAVASRPPRRSRQRQRMGCGGGHPDEATGSDRR